MLSRPPPSLAASTSARRGARSELGARARIVGHARLGDHRRQPVAAQQEDVAVARRIRLRVDARRPASGPERARDDRALRMLVGLLGRQLALAHELLDQRVVVGQALELAVAEAGTRGCRRRARSRRSCSPT